MKEQSTDDHLRIKHYKWYVPVKILVELFGKSEQKVRIVGGAVRDIILSKQPKDVDLCTTASPTEMLDILVKSGTFYRETGIQHGTVTIYKKGQCFEMTSLRLDAIENGEKVCKYGKSFEEDASRRDLTINAMSLDIEGRLYDYFQGQEHLVAGNLRFVENAELRVAEDPLRILRYFRFASCSEKFQDECPAEYQDVFRAKSQWLGDPKKVAGERIWKEMEKVLSSPKCCVALDAMDQCGLLTSLGFPDIRKNSYLELIDGSASVPGVKDDVRAATVLGLIFKGKPDLLQDHLDRWRVSNRVKEDANTAAFISIEPSLSEIKKSLYGEHPLRFDEQKEVFIETLSKDKQCSFSGDQITELREFTRPVFPFTKDHFGQVPEFKTKQRDALDMLKEEWIKSTFTMEVKDMIDVVKEMAVKTTVKSG